MTGVGRLRRVRVLLIALAIGRGTMLGAAFGLAVVAGAAAIDAWVGLARDVRMALAPAAFGLALGVALLALWRSRRVFELAGVALWLERRVPDLRYALVTLLEGSGAALRDALEAAVAATTWRTALVRAAGRALTRPLVPLGAAALLVFVMPAGAVRRVTAPGPGDALDRPGIADPLAPLVVTVRPPPYTRLRDTVLDDPVAVTALVGATLTIQGRSTAARVTATLGDGPMVASSSGTRWTVTFPMPATATALRLASGGAHRVLVLDPIADSLPRVTLRVPVRDTVLRAATGTLTLAAEATDDHGLASLRFEYLVSAGEGETYTFHSGALPAVPIAGARRSEQRAALRLDTLGLLPGNVVHLRAVATDANDVTGPGAGVSETRTIRIARPDEYDSLAIAAAPPIGGDTAMLSQRMLIVRAETLEVRRPALSRAALVSAATALGRDQARLRRQVGDVIFMRLGLEPIGEHAHDEADEPGAALTPEALLRAAEAAAGQTEAEALDFHGDETPVVAINRPLLEAYNAMWDATRALEVGEPADALPHMYAALEAIQRARRAERVYLRGRPPAVVVDLGRARLAGNRRDAAAGARSARAAPPDDRAALRARLERAIAATDTRAALDSLAALRVAVAGRAPALTDALDRTMQALRAGADPAAAFREARAALGGDVRHRPGLTPWAGAW